VSLDLLEEELSSADTLYTGHGDCGRPAGMISAQRRYLLHYRKTVRELAGGQSFLSKGGKEDLVRAMKEILSTDALEGFVAAGADAVASELSSEGR